MSREYDEIMEHIQVTPEMRERVLAHIRRTDIAVPSPKVLPFSGLKKYWSVAACFALLLVGAVALPHLLDREASEPPVQVVPQIEEAASLQELSDLVGFEVSEELSLPFAPEKISYLSFWRELAEITYSGSGQTVVFRQSIGDGDNSGNYTVYAETEIKEIGGLRVTLKGDGQTYPLAIWNDGTYAYSISTEPGLAASEWEAVIAGMG